MNSSYKLQLNMKRLPILLHIIAIHIIAIIMTGAYFFHAVLGVKFTAP